MQNEIHPITRRIIDALAGGEESLDDAEMRACANLIVDSRDGDTIGVQLIALARQMVELKWITAAEQVVVLSGLALGDAAGSTIAALPRTGEPSLHFTPATAPANAVAGGPAARASLEAVIDRGDGGLEAPYTKPTDPGKAPSKRKLF